MSKCHSCKYRKNIPGDTHSKCEYPLLKPQDAMNITMASMANPDAFNKVVLENFGFTASTHALQSGYFCFPSNFDPTWMEGDCTKHSDIVGEHVEFQLIMEKSLLRHSVMKIGVQESKIEDSELIQVSIEKYNEALNYIQSQNPDGITPEEAEKTRLVFKEKLLEADKFFIDSGLLKEFKAIPEFANQPI